MITWNSLLYLIYLQSQFQHPRKGTTFLLHHKMITADLMNFYIWHIGWQDYKGQGYGYG